MKAYAGMGVYLPILYLTLERCQLRFLCLPLYKDVVVTMVTIM